MSEPVAQQPAGHRWILRQAHRIGRAVGAACLIVTIGLLGLFAASRVAGYSTLIVRSGSMTGTADTGSIVVARPLAVGSVDVGDVILMRPEVDGVVRAPVLHRVIEIGADEAGQVIVRTKGDANPAADPLPYVLRGATVTPVYVIPRVGFAVALLQTPAGWFGGIMFPALIATAVVLSRVWRREDLEPLVSAGTDDSGGGRPYGGPRAQDRDGPRARDDRAARRVRLGRHATDPGRPGR